MIFFAWHLYFAEADRATALVGVGEKPPEFPDPADMDHGKEPGSHHGEYGHGPGGPVETTAEFRSK